MSLTEPNIIERIIAWIPQHVRVVLYCVGGLILLLAVLFGVQYCGNWKEQRAIDKLKANIKIASNEIANAQTDKAKADANLAAAKQKLADETGVYLQAVNLTDQGKQVVKQAQENLNAAIASNIPVGTTANDLQKRLEDLDR